MDAPDDPLTPEGDGGDDDEMIMVPLGLISSADDLDAGAFEAEAPLDAEPGGGFAPSAARQGVAGAFQDLMGDEMDAEGVAADLIDAGRELVMWGVRPSADAVAIVPDLDDWSDPDAWLEALDDMDLPASLEGEIARLAEEALRGIEGRGEQTARLAFATGLGDLFRGAGIDALGVQRIDGGFDWITLSRDDLAREADGEPWAPPGGFDEESAAPALIGVSLGMGGRVFLWLPQRAETLKQDGGAEAKPTQQQNGQDRNGNGGGDERE